MSQSKDRYRVRSPRSNIAAGRGSIEVGEFASREQSSQVDSRSLVGTVCALASFLLHAGFLTTVVWIGASRTHSPEPPERLAAASVSDSEEAALEWITLDESPATESPWQTSTPAIRPKLTPVHVRVDVTAFTVTFDEETERDTKVAGEADQPSKQAFAQYVGQINARIDRAWLRPRSPIGDPRFVCQVRIEQDVTGKVTEVALERCNGSPRWQMSLVHAIESASPLPAPTDPSVFAHAIHMSFEGVPAESAVSLEQYEPSNNPGL